MRVITSKEKAAGAVHEWFERYCPAGNWYKNSVTSDQSEYKRVYTALRALGENPEPQQVEEIIGNLSWTTEHCSACGKRATRWLAVRSDCNEIRLCPECVKVAHEQMFPTGA